VSRDALINRALTRAAATPQPRGRDRWFRSANATTLPWSAGGVRRGVAAGLMLAIIAVVAGVGFRGTLGFAAPDGPAPQLRPFTLTASEIDWEIMAGTTVKAWAYNGQMPGPEIRVREGDRVRVTLVNHLPVSTTVHWHGIDVTPEQDGPAGLNQAAVEPGQDFVYEFIATNPGSRWYHSHADPSVQVALGLYGSFIVEPRRPKQTYDREFTYMLNEWDMELTPDVATGKAPRGPRDQQLRGGELGTDLFLMNGHAHESIPPVTVKKGERVLVRLVNAGNLPHAIHTHGHSFKIVATDGNDVPKAAQLTKDTVLIGPGERYDLELNADNPGVWMFHCHMENHASNGMMTLIEYDGATPTGPAAEFYRPGGGLGPGQAGHGGHPGHDPAAAASTPATMADDPSVEGPATAGAVEVAMLDDHFGPKSVAVPSGTVVTFVNRGSHMHSVGAYDGSFGSPNLAPGEHFSVRLDTLGAHTFICRQHGLRGMTGMITVT
jgi:plastocyanin